MEEGMKRADGRDSERLTFGIQTYNDKGAYCKAQRQLLVTRGTANFFRGNSPGMGAVL